MYGPTSRRRGAKGFSSRACRLLTNDWNTVRDPSSPGLRKSNSAHRSLRRFSTGVQVRAMRAPAESFLTARL